MTARVRIAVFVALALLCAPSARALDAGAALRSNDAILATIDLTNKAVVEGSDERVYGSGWNLQQLVNGGAAVVYRPSLHQVQRAQVTGEASTIKDMLKESRRLMQASDTVPSPELSGDLALQESMDAQHRIGFDSSLEENEMGVFRYKHGEAAKGTISANPWLAEIGKLVGNAFAAATLFHEGGHAANAVIDNEGVVDGEVPAFQLQYAWLKFVDPTGERLALLRVALDEQMAAHPTKLTQMAIDYARTLDVLRGTGGDAKKIAAFAGQLGYKEGQGKTAVPLPGQ